MPEVASAPSTTRPRSCRGTWVVSREYWATNHRLSPSLLWPMSKGDSCIQAVDYAGRQVWADFSMSKAARITPPTAALGNRLPRQGEADRPPWRRGGPRETGPEGGCAPRLT